MISSTWRVILNSRYTIIWGYFYRTGMQNHLFKPIAAPSPQILSNQLEIDKMYAQWLHSEWCFWIHDGQFCGVASAGQGCRTISSNYFVLTDCLKNKVQAFQSVSFTGISGKAAHENQKQLKHQTCEGVWKIWALSLNALWTIPNGANKVDWHFGGLAEDPIFGGCWREQRQKNHKMALLQRCFMAIIGMGVQGVLLPQNSKRKWLLLKK